MPVTVIDTIEPKNEAFIAVVDAHRVGNGDVDNTELSTLNGITSNVQDQLDAKQATFDVGTGLELSTGESLVIEQATQISYIQLGKYGGHEVRVGQSFQLPMDGGVTKVSIYTGNDTGTPTGVVTLRIETNNAGFPSGTLVHVSATQTNADCKSIGWHEFVFSENIDLAALTTYWVVLDCDNQSDSNQYFNIGDDNLNNLYANGLTVQKYDGTWQAYGTVTDICFRVYAYLNNLHTLDSEIVHDSLSGFVANEHIDHTTVSITAGTGLTGGGTIAANRTLSLSFLGLQSLTDPGADKIMFWDDGEAALKWLSVSTGLTLAGTVLTTDDSTIVHDSLSGFVANEHIDHSTVSIATAAAGGLSGGGDIGTTRNLIIDIPGLAAQAAPTASDDYVMIYDAGEAALRKVLLGDLPAGSWENPMTTAGDLVLGGASGAPTRLAIGTSTYVLTSNGTTAVWAAPGAGSGGSDVREIINSLLATYVALDHTAGAFQLLCDAAVDAFEGETGVDAVTSTGETYDSANDWYSPGGSSIDQNQDTENGNAAVGDSGGVEYRWAQSFIPSGDIGCPQISAYFGARAGSPSGNLTFRIETDNAGLPSGSLVHADATKAQAITDNQWNVFVFPTTIALSAATTYWLVSSCSVQSTGVYWNWRFNTAGGYGSGKQVRSTNGGSSWTDVGLGYDETFRIYAAGDMVLQSNAFTAVTQPDTARIVILERDVDAITLNTDFKAWLSRDGGTTFTQATLTDKGNFDANLQILYGTADISGQPAGTSMIWKLTTHNSKTMRIKGVALAWE